MAAGGVGPRPHPALFHGAEQGKEFEGRTPALPFHILISQRTFASIDRARQLSYCLAAMSKITRFGVSLDSGLLRRFDAMIGSLGYANRSEAIRDLIRDRLVSKEWENPDGETVGVLSLIYNHETRELTEKLNTIQHEHIELVVASTHIHLDAHNCLEVIILKGRSGLIRKIADRLQIAKDVKHGRLIMTTTGARID